jgi:hypothetical protein
MIGSAQKLLMARAGVPSGGGVITDGLQIFVDAGDSDSYPGSGTTWADISGNDRDATLVGAITYSSNFGGYFNFPSATTGEYAAFSGVTLSNYTEATFICFFRRSATNSDVQGLIFNRGVLREITGLNLDGNQIRYHWKDASNTWGFNSGLSVGANEWIMAAVSVTSTSAVLYRATSSGGLSSATNNVSHAAATMSALEIGRDPESTNREYLGDISIALVYNRALSQTEIQQTYDAFKGRYT